MTEESPCFCLPKTSAPASSPTAKAVAIMCQSSNSSIPLALATWLFSELDEDGDILFGLCDLGFGCPEMGSASLAEIAAVSLPFGLTIERDLCFEGRFPLTIYADAARVAGSITEDEARLEAAAVARASELSELPPP